MIFGFAPTSSRPWLGAFKPEYQTDWIPMSWLEEGQFNSDKTKEGKEIVSRQDVPFIAGKARIIRSAIED